MSVLLQVHQLCKTYGAVEALDNVSLEVNEAEVLGVCGDNGAGKSTLMRIIAGAIEPTAGTLIFDGVECRFNGPRDALASGIAAIYQDLALAVDQPIYQNIFLGSEILIPTFVPGMSRLDKTTMRQQSGEFLSRIGISLPNVDSPVSQLSGGQRQAVAICRALRWHARLVIMDEPTAALGIREKSRVLDLIRRLRDNGISIVLVSHNMDDVVSVTDRIAVLRGGKHIGTLTTTDVDADRLSHIVMSGRVDAA
ncbi:MAG: sugar ABC transporter ATP-binding protein [marine bacterium B5-7]|nr:MAG: sugar ABC transporter ATP-binding protein [marine bacterium B5-7]